MKPSLLRQRRTLVVAVIVSLGAAVLVLYRRGVAAEATEGPYESHGSQQTERQLLGTLRRRAGLARPGG